MERQAFRPYKYNQFRFNNLEFDIRNLFSKDYFQLGESSGTAIRSLREEAAFISATRQLITVYSEDFREARPHNYELLLEYINEWGAPLLTTEELLGDAKKYGDNDYFEAFRAACYTSELILSLWINTSVNFDVISACKALSTISPGLSGSARVFLNVLERAEGSPLPNWLADDSGLNGRWNVADLGFYLPFPAVGTFLPIEFRIESKEIKKIAENHNNVVFCQEWLRNKFLHGLAHNIAVSAVSVMPHVNGGGISVDFVLHSNLLFYIKSSIDKSKGFCACGCGKVIPPDRRVYATGRCYGKINHKANHWRGLYMMLQSRYDRAKAKGKPTITLNELGLLQDEVKRLYKEQRKTIDEIREIINPKYYELVEAHQKKGGQTNASKNT